jgi:hypothetical protein
MRILPKTGTLKTFPPKGGVIGSVAQQRQQLTVDDFALLLNTKPLKS